MSEQGKPDKRTVAEWVTLGVSIAILVAVFGAITWFYFTRNSADAVIEVKPRAELTRQIADAYYVPIEITNTGGRTAADVQVVVSHASGDDHKETSQFSIQFLAGGATSRGMAVFHTDPASGEITVDVISYLEP
jgi:uncharacterized protein (TIGR02588 family)